MAVTGAHVLLYSSEPEALRAVFKDVLGWDHVDAGDGWLIFGLPPAEIAVHPAESPSHELTLMCDDLAPPSPTCAPPASRWPASRPIRGGASW